MRVLVTSNMGWLALPFIALVGVAYIWIASAVVGRSSRPQIVERRTDRAA